VRPCNAWTNLDLSTSPMLEPVRFSPLEHRLLSDLSAAQGMSVENLIRESLTLPPYEPETRVRHLRIVRRSDGDEIHTTSHLAL
jgi:hypothetical protein